MQLLSELRTAHDQLRLIVSSLSKDDIHFKDIHDKSLIEYAAAMGDLELVQRYLSQGASWQDAFCEALKNDQMGIIQYLIPRLSEANNDKTLQGIKLFQCKGEAKEWFKNFLQNEITNPESSVFTDRFFIHKRLGELGNYQLINSQPTLRSRQTNSHFFIQTNSWVFSKEWYETIIAAVENDQVEFLDHIHKIAPNFLEESFSYYGYHYSKYTSSLLHKAIELKASKIISFLIKQVKINHNQQDRWKYTPLMRAIRHGEKEAFNLLLEHTDLNLLSIHQENIFHLAAAYNTEFLILLLKKVPESSIATYLHQKNIYGKTVWDVAKSSNPEVLSQLEPYFPDNALSPHHQEKYLNTNISHLSVFKNMHFYLRLNEREIPPDLRNGKCNGYTFLYEIYNSQNRQKYFFETLALMAQWDGTQVQLDKLFDEDLPQKMSGGYKNLGELFEGWINDLLWAQDANKMYGQHQRLEMYQAVQQPNSEDALVQLSFFSKGCKITSVSNFKQLEELVHLLAKLPVGVNVELMSVEHSFCFVKQENGMLINYDSNMHYPCSATDDPAQMTQRMIDFAYILFEKEILEHEPLNYFLHFISKESIEQKFEHFTCFKEDEFPKDTGDALQFREKSANQFSPLHVAALLRDNKTFKRLIEDGYCDPLAKDARGHTPLDYALVYSNKEILELYEPKDIFAVYVMPPRYRLLLTHVIERSVNPLDALDYYFKKSRLIKPFDAKPFVDEVVYSAIRCRNLSWLQVAVENGFDVNKFDYYPLERDPLLAFAVRVGSPPEIINYLLDLPRLDLKLNLRSPHILQHEQIDNFVKKFYEVNKTNRIEDGTISKILSDRNVRALRAFLRYEAIQFNAHHFSDFMVFFSQLSEPLTSSELEKIFNACAPELLIKLDENKEKFLDEDVKHGLLLAVQNLDETRPQNEEEGTSSRDFQTKLD